MMWVNTWCALCNWACIITSLLVPTHGSNIGGTRQDITLSAEGGYGNVLVAIDDAVPEDLQLLAQIKTVFTSASDVLFDTTNQQVYFDNVTILVPPSWTRDASWEQPSGKEKVDRARIIVGEANRAWGDTPYTLQPGLCGVEGDYILLTLDYLLSNSGKPTIKQDRRLVREFAHLKWGLFDEDVPVKHPGTSPIYIDDETIRFTRCQQDGFYGPVVDSQDSTTICKYDESSMTVKPPTCSFVPDDATSTASVSMLYAEYISSVTSFCSDKTHDPLAPNRQNLLCGQKSAWEVMNSLEDFAVDHKQQRGGALPAAPTFTILQNYREVVTPSSTTTQTSQGVSATVNATTTEVECQQDVVCLALDVSGSMTTNNRIGMVESAVKTYITTFLKLGTAVGIIAFNHVSTVLADMTELRSQVDKDGLLAVVPSYANGGTRIGDALNKCTDILSTYAGDRVSQSRILVLSDGEEANTFPQVADVIPGIASIGITVDSILYSQDADNVLIKATQDTGGTPYAVSDNTPEENLNPIMQATVQTQCEEVTAIIESRKITLPSDGSSVTREVHFDATIGVNTTLSFSYTVDIEVSVIAENGNTATITKDTALKIITVEIDGEVTGSVQYTITKVSPSVPTPEEVIIIVTSNPVPGVDQIVINSRVTDVDIAFVESTQVSIYVDVFQKFTPIFGLTVIATIETNTGEEKPLQCTDDGKGMDSTPLDGVYTATFNAHEFTGDGYYSIRISVDGEGRRPGEKVSNRQKRCTNCTTDALGRVVRTASAGALSVAGHKPVSDGTPPEKINDLTASGNDSGIFTLTWTAPGDDLNIGNASGNIFVVSNESTLSHLRVLPANDESILTDTSALVAPSGAKLELMVDIRKINTSMFGEKSESLNTSTFYFRVAAYDDEGNQAAYSNVAPLTIVNPANVAFATVETTTIPTTTTTTIKPTTTSKPPTTTTTIKPTTTSKPPTTTTTQTTKPTTVPITTSTLTTFPIITSTTSTAANISVAPYDTAATSIILGSVIGIVSFVALVVGITTAVITCMKSSSTKADSESGFKTDFYSRAIAQHPPYTLGNHQSPHRLPVRNHHSYVNHGYNGYF